MPDDYPVVRKNQKVKYHGEKDVMLEILKLGGTGDAWLSHKNDKDDLDAFWAREGDGPGEWEPVPPRKKPKKEKG